MPWSKDQTPCALVEVAKGTKGSQVPPPAGVSGWDRFKEQGGQRRPRKEVYCQA